MCILPILPSPQIAMGCKFQSPGVPGPELSKPLGGNEMTLDRSVSVETVDPQARVHPGRRER